MLNPQSTIPEGGEKMQERTPDLMMAKDEVTPEDKRKEGRREIKACQHFVEADANISLRRRESGGRESRFGARA